MTVTSSKNRGFSLVELMFSMAIGSMILILAATMLGNAGESYERVGGGVATEREARAVISQLSADFSTAKFHKDSVIEKSTLAWATDRVGFLSLQPADAQSEAGRIGDLCAVNYYLEDLTIGGKVVRCLMRGFRESKDTFDGLGNGAIQPLFDKRSTVDEPIAFGVVSFAARPKSRDATGKWADWVKSDTVGPEAFEVKLVVARRELSGRLKLASDWDGTGSSGKFLGSATEPERNKYLEVYTTFIRFGHHAAL
jgi:prepilin-type N-terminal cleavage/methylation domain-containing protein